jgi:hypothetical protein
MLYSIMPVAEKTYTFRASKDLGPRAREALSTMSSLLEDASDSDLEEAMSVFWIAVFRRVRELEQPENQSALFRTTLEAFVDAAEKLARDREYVREYEKWAADDEEGAAFRAAARKAVASRWAE